MASRTERGDYWATLLRGDETEGFARGGLIETLERSTSSRFLLVRGVARLAVAVDALRLPVMRGLKQWAERLPIPAKVTSPTRILARGLLGLSAALTAISTGIAAGILHSPTGPAVAGGLTTAVGGGGLLGDGALSAGSWHPQGGQRPPRTPPPSLSVAVLATPPPSPPAPGPPPTTAPPPTYVNPLGKIADLQPARIDEGVDYGGSGPLLALGSGVIRQTAGAGWPGGTFIALALDKGPLAGRVVYYAENITPSVSPGRHVSAGDVVGNLQPGFPHLEIGWAGGGVGGGVLGEALARTNGGDVDGVSSALGIDFNAVLVFLGAPSGIRQGAMGGLPALWAIPAH